MAERDDHDELLRCRERLHHLETRISAAEFFVNDLREWRAQARVQLDGLVKADEIAEAVADKMRSERTLHFTLAQKAAAFLVGAVAVADGVRGMIG